MYEKGTPHWGRRLQSIAVTPTFPTQYKKGFRQSTNELKILTSSYVHMNNFHGLNRSQPNYYCVD